MGVLREAVRVFRENVVRHAADQRSPAAGQPEPGGVIAALSLSRPATAAGSYAAGPVQREQHWYSGGRLSLWSAQPKSFARRDSHSGAALPGVDRAACRASAWQQQQQQQT